MKVYFPTCTAFLLLASTLSHTGKLLAAPPAPPPGACLYALDTSATDAFQIAGAQSVDTACGVVAESSASSAFEMEGSETLYFENHALVSAVGGAQLSGLTYLYGKISDKDVQVVRPTSPRHTLTSITPPIFRAIISKSPANFQIHSNPLKRMLSSNDPCASLNMLTTDWVPFQDSSRVFLNSAFELSERRIA